MIDRNLLRKLVAAGRIPATAAPRNKYGNRRKVCKSGHNHASTLEATHCDRLRTMKNGGAIKDYKVQWKVGIAIGCRLIGYHVVDFMVVHNDNKIEYVESKGKATDLWEFKRKCVEALYPNVVYTVWK